MDKLLHKVKRERKAAKKDLRKDTAFLAKQKAKEARERLVKNCLYMITLMVAGCSDPDATLLSLNEITTLPYFQFPEIIIDFFSFLVMWIDRRRRRRSWAGWAVKKENIENSWHPRKGKSDHNCFIILSGALSAQYMLLSKISFKLLRLVAVFLAFIL